MGNKESLLTKEEVEELQETTPFSVKDINALLRRYGSFVVSTETKAAPVLTVDQVFMMPEFSGNLFLRPMIRNFLEESETFIKPYQFIELCAILCPQASIQKKRELLYDYLDFHKKNRLRYEEIFRLLKHLFGQSLTDDHLLVITHQILSDPQLSTPGEIQLQDLDKIIPDNEILHRLTITFNTS